MGVRRRGAWPSLTKQASSEASDGDDPALGLLVDPGPAAPPGLPPPPPPPPAPVGLLAFGAERAARGSRAVRWGPFQIAEVYLHGEHVGFGATCGRHLDTERSSETACKKSVRWCAEGLTPEQCIVRLKRWLLAGFEQEASWGDRARAMHVALGGAGLRAFAEGPPEPELDAALAAYMQPAAG